jgi:hypothetical protein
MSESPYNPVAAAVGNALADATGVRFNILPFKADGIWKRLMQHPPFSRTGKLLPARYRQAMGQGDRSKNEWQDAG